MTSKLLLSALAAASLAGCMVQDDSTVKIGNLCAPTDDCTFADTCDAIAMDGRLAVDLLTTGNTLEFPIQIDNQLPDNADVVNGRVNTNDARIERLELRYQASGFAIPRVVSNETHVVPAEGSTVIMAHLIPPAAGAALRAALPAGPVEVMIFMKAVGQYGSGHEFETGEYPISVDVTQQGFVQGCADPAQTITLACPQLGQTAAVVCE